LVIFGLALQVGGPAGAGELGHYGPALPDVRDLLVPAKPGFYFKQYSYYYTSNTFRDRNGNEVSTIPLPGGGTATLDVDVDVFVLAPTFMWVSDWEVLGAHYAAYAIPTFGNSSVGASLATETGFGLSSEESGFGVGDLFVEPIWLGWNRTHWDFAVGYGFYAPTGKFEQGAADNIGLGFWSHQFQGAVAWYPWAERGTAVVGAVTYEINQEVEDSDVTPGQRLSLNLGVSQYLPLGKSGFLAELGAVAYGQWQVTDDSGTNSFQSNVHDQIVGIGPQLGLVYVPWNAALTFKWAHEFAAENRFEGDNFTLNFGVGFD
jgi:hypothetical protein